MVDWLSHNVPAYKIKNLVKIYPGQAQPANQDINLQIHQGELFELQGDNGAGKSTLHLDTTNALNPQLTDKE